MGSAPRDDFVLRLRDGVLQMSWKAGASIDAVTARAAVEAVNEKAHGRPCLLLLDISGMVYVSHSARRILAEPSAASRIAVVGSGPVEQMLVSYQVGTKDLPCPTRYFPSTAEAMNWLRRATEEPNALPS